MTVYISNRVIRLKEKIRTFREEVKALVARMKARTGSIL